MNKTEKESGASPVLPERYKCQLQRILHRDTKKIVKQFFYLSSNTLKLMKTEGISVEEFKEYISRISLTVNKGTSTLLDVVQPETTVYGVFFSLEKQYFITFYKFSILEFIIENLCIDNDRKLKEELEEYKVQFSVYIKRRVCESSLYYGGEFNPGDTFTPKEGCNLVLITDESWNREASLEAVLDLEGYVADIFGIQKFVLCLKRVEENCLRLYHSIPICVEHIILSIKHEQAQKLMKCGIAEIYCGNCHMVLQTCK